MNEKTDQKLETAIEETKTLFEALEKEMSKAIVGQKSLLKALQIALLADGHILLEGLPGLAKTLAVTTLAKALSLDFKRIQFTPDLLPADLIGTTVFNPKEGTFSVNKGPIFTNILLADEINRAPAKVQAALLEVMQERQVTISKETFKTNSPYLVLATQNPVEHEGTYTLPEAQIDRFMMKVLINYPTMEEELEILNRMAILKEKPKINPVMTGVDILRARELLSEIYIDKNIENYILEIVFATRDPKRFDIPLEGLILYGASPRASLYLTLGAKAHALLEGRSFVTPHDVKSIVYDILRHRIKPSFEAEAEEITSEGIIKIILETITPP